MMMMMILLVLLLFLLYAPRNCTLIGCGDFEFDNTTPYRVETICKKRLKCGPINAERGEDHNGPLTSLIR